MRRALSVVGLVLASCASPPTQLLVVVTSDLGAELDTVRLEVGAPGAVPSSHEVSGVDATRPFSFGVAPAGGDATRRVRVTATALDAEDRPIVRVVRETGFRAGRTLRLELRLERSCQERYLQCAATETCVDGACVSASIDPSSLEEVVPGSELDPRDGGSPRDAGAPDAGGPGGPSCTPLVEGCGTRSIAGGTFEMGQVGVPDATPIRPGVQVTNFTMDVHEVTVARFRRFFEAGMPAPTSAIEAPGGAIAWSAEWVVLEPTPSSTSDPCNWSRVPGTREAHPVNCLTFQTALAFCAWDGGRLPTEAEWEWVARGRALLDESLRGGRSYPWGEAAPTCELAAIAECPGQDGAFTRRVGGRPPNGGMHDLGGNVAEWVLDEYGAYDSTCWTVPIPTNPRCIQGTGIRVLRGGAFELPESTALAAARFFASDRVPSQYAGIRCVYP